MHTNGSITSARVANYKLSSSYPSIKPFSSKDLPYGGFLSLESCNSLTRSWGSSQSAKCDDYLRCCDAPSNSDLQPLTWLQKQSIIDIVPLDLEEEPRDDTLTPGHDALLDPHMCCPREEVETQENSNIQDFVRFQAQRSTMSHQRLALRQHNVFCPDPTQNYSYKVNGHTKPNLSYTQLIFMAIETCKDRAMTVNDIYQWCEVNYPYYKHIGPSWKNSLRHNLSINKSFRRMPRDGQISIGKCDMVSTDDIIDDLVSRDNKQGGPGRGAYWVVDDKERKNLLESICRAQQTIPLADRNEQRADQPFPLIVNQQNNGPLLCIDGRFTDASTYLQSRRSDDEVAIENRQIMTSPPPPDASPDKLEDSNDTDFAAMMRGLTSSGSPDTADTSVKLSASANSQFSKTENPDSEATRPKLKSRRKSTHEKVRSYTEIESSNKEGDTQTSPKHGKEFKAGQSMTSVNVVVAPHFDHIYARYQQFLPPAIASDMEKTAFSQQQDHDSNPDAEFLKNGYREEEEENEDEETDKPNLFASVIKTEKTEMPQPPMSRHRGDPKAPTVLNTSNMVFATRRKIKRAITQRSQTTAKRAKIPAPLIEVKEEMLEPTESATKDNEGRSDGYNTDSTMPMLGKDLRRSARAQTSVNGKSRLFTKRNPKLAFNAGRRYRPKRKRSRPLRIDELQELSAITILANLERRHQHMRNIDNLYKLNNFLNISQPSQMSPPVSLT